MNLKKLIQLLLLPMIMTLVIKNCFRNNKILAVHNYEKNIIIKNDLCDAIVSKGDIRTLCKTWQSNAIIISKTKNQSGVRLFVEMFSEKDWLTVLAHTDSITNCPVDFFINYLEGSIEITDLDNNGQKEITFLYEKACRGGVEPADLQLIKIENKEIYTVKGKRILKIDNDKTEDKHVMSSNFLKAPKLFSDHAIKKWKEYLIEQ